MTIAFDSNGTRLKPRAELEVEIEKMHALLRRWINIAENGMYGERLGFPLKKHPIVFDTYAALHEPAADEQTATKE